MVDVPLNLILSRLESNPPKITKAELGDALQQCLALGLLRQAKPVRALPCSECDGSRLLAIEFVQNQLTKKNHAYIACPECGSVEISIEQLERWRVDPVAVAKAVFRQLFPALNLPTEILPSRLWRVGKVTLAGQTREILFACGYRQRVRGLVRSAGVPTLLGPLAVRLELYNLGGIEVIDAIEAWELGFHLGNVVKYVARAPHKGCYLEDLRKARWYLDRQIELAAKQTATPGMQAEEAR